MINGVGIDIIEVKRVEEKIRKGQGFRELVFAADEIAYCEKMTRPYQHYAARFAAKEAFFKAVGTGWANNTAFNEVAIVHAEEGRPLLELRGRTAAWAREKGIGDIQVSMAHLAEMATAIVMIVNK
jgi:holo-[acyl-carrier protein] synthase